MSIWNNVWNSIDSLRFASLLLAFGIALGGVVAAGSTFLRIVVDRRATELESVAKKEAERKQTERFEGLQTGGDTFCYFMLYDFNMQENFARDFTIIRKGEYPLYDVQVRIMNVDTAKDVYAQPWGEISAPATFKIDKWPLTENVYFRIFFNARNGSWHQDLILKKSTKAKCWLASTKVMDRTNTKVIFQHQDSEFAEEFGAPEWKP